MCTALYCTILYCRRCARPRRRRTPPPGAAPCPGPCAGACPGSSASDYSANKYLPTTIYQLLSRYLSTTIYLPLSTSSSSMFQNFWSRYIYCYWLFPLPLIYRTQSAVILHVITAAQGCHVAPELYTASPRPSPLSLPMLHVLLLLVSILSHLHFRKAFYYQQHLSNSGEGDDGKGQKWDHHSLL